jgi:hypothetical protein
MKPRCEKDEREEASEQSIEAPMECRENKTAGQTWVEEIMSVGKRVQDRVNMIRESGLDRHGGAGKSRWRGPGSNHEIRVFTISYLAIALPIWYV